ncbi:MAG: hypothetical protein U0871_00105 [Gemmataceae bacterium]
MPDLIPLDAPDPDPAVLGGKGYGLAKLLAAGLPVPPGFVIPAAADRSDPALRQTVLAAAQRSAGRWRCGRRRRPRTRPRPASPASTPRP